MVIPKFVPVVPEEGEEGDDATVATSKTKASKGGKKGKGKGKGKEEEEEGPPLDPLTALVKAAQPRDDVNIERGRAREEKRGELPSSVGGRGRRNGASCPRPSSRG